MNWPHTVAETGAAVISDLSAIIAVVAAAATIWFARRNLLRELVNQRINLVATKADSGQVAP